MSPASSLLKRTYQTAAAQRNHSLFDRLLLNSSAGAPTRSVRVIRRDSIIHTNRCGPCSRPVQVSYSPCRDKFFGLNFSAYNQVDQRCSGNSNCSLQFTQMRRTNAVRKSGDEVATRNAQYPCHQTADGGCASLVCSVDRTMWPVSAAFTPISPFKVADLSDQMMFGSCRKKARNAAAKFNPICSFICTWLMPLN